MLLDLEAFEVIVPILRPCDMLLFVVTELALDCRGIISCSVNMYGIAHLHL